MLERCLPQGLQGASCQGAWNREQAVSAPEYIAEEQTKQREREREGRKEGRKGGREGGRVKDVEQFINFSPCWLSSGYAGICTSCKCRHPIKLPGQMHQGWLAYSRAFFGSSCKEHQVMTSTEQCCDTLCGGYTCGKGWHADPLRVGRPGGLSGFGDLV